MITVAIGGAERELLQARPDWINEQIRRFRDEGAVVCVRVRIQCRDIDIGLATPGCGFSSLGRAPNADEQEIIRLLERARLNRTDFTPGNLIAFLNQLDRAVGPC